MKKILIITFIFTAVIACKADPETLVQDQEQETQQTQDQQDPETPTNYVQVPVPQGNDLTELLDQAEHDATPEGRQILEMARMMISNQEIVIGSCWDYMNAVYKKAEMLKTTVFSSRYAGPYLQDFDMIQTGDWLYFVNHTYYDGEHSGIFVAWLDQEKKEALMINYVGENRIKPGTYKKYVIDEVYNIMRPVN